MQTEVEDVMPTGGPSFFLMFPTPLCFSQGQMHFLPPGLITTPSPPHTDFKANQQIRVVPNLASITNSSTFISLSLSPYQMSFIQANTRPFQNPQCTYTTQSTTYSYMPIALLVCSGSHHHAVSICLVYTY